MTILSVLLTTLLLSLPLPSTQDLNADRAALLSLRSSVGGRTFCWDIRHTSPCNWAGVKCDNNRVTALRLPGVSLSGTIPNGVFRNLTRLRTLSLRLNALAGSLTLDLTTSSDLRHLYLQGNRFSGKYPRACSVSLTSIESMESTVLFSSFGENEGVRVRRIVIFGGRVN
ncbi:unnamed protein product [Brassica rapa]|uniref:Leucine-rich repeat-containing N-terminal plant-type domain-containing protein n=2 Tax=Brassica TaxID=3705 RepID=A0A3P6BPL9_BRACM|nr:unnamed protein product [Brassica napus]CAG7896704.1 unnamed protein product [Brassica rapa]VDD02904.1 unnamed protein product [Brassica rapa]